MTEHMGFQRLIELSRFTDFDEQDTLNKRLRILENKNAELNGIELIAY